MPPFGQGNNKDCRGDPKMKYWRKICFAPTFINRCSYFTQIFEILKICLPRTQRLRLICPRPLLEESLQSRCWDFSCFGSNQCPIVCFFEHFKIRSPDHQWICFSTCKHWRDRSLRWVRCSSCQPCCPLPPWPEPSRTSRTISSRTPSVHQRHHYQKQYQGQHHHLLHINPKSSSCKSSSWHHHHQRWHHCCNHNCHPNHNQTFKRLFL